MTLPPARRRLAVDAVLAAAVFAAGVAVCLAYGNRGFDDDDSPVFDGGWRILSGQVPFHDFHMVFALVPSAIQAVFFKLFGVTYVAFVLHAAVFNGLFGVGVWMMLRRLGGGTWLAALYGALGAVVFYAPRGVAFMDVHAYFFAFAAVLLQVYTLRWHDARRLFWGYAGVAVLVLLAFFSKQSPTFLFAPLLLFLLAMLGRARWPAACLGIAAGTAAGLAPLVLLLATSPLGWDELFYYLWTLPAGIGADRLKPWGGSVLVLLRETFWHHAQYIAIAGPIYLTHAIGIAVAIHVLRAGRWRPARAMLAHPAFLPMAVAWMLLWINLIFSQLSHNHVIGNVHFLFVALGGANVALVAAIRAELAPVEGAGRAAANLALLVSAAIGLFALERADFYRRKPLKYRMVYNLVDIRNEERRLRFPGLEFLRWMPTSERRPRAVWGMCSADEVDEILYFLKGRPENFVGHANCIGSLAHGLTGKPSPGPIINPGYGAPPPDDPAFPAYKARLRDSFRRHDVRLFVNIDPVEEAAIAEILDGLGPSAVCERLTVGRHPVTVLCPGAWGR